ncbi:MAG: hypothetical protein KAI61_01910 [Alphaproteobacteria bacterium]|nr:hypothetical protein [Alphaproteobacteria bacterium]
MRRTFFPALLILTFLGLSVTAAQAQLSPGCNQQIMDIQVRHSDAMRTRDKAYERQILKHSDPTSGLTCFDQSMRLTARLGQIFSDLTPTPPILADSGVGRAFEPTWPDIDNPYPFGVVYPDWGVYSLLAIYLDTNLTPILIQNLENFVFYLGLPIFTDVLTSLIPPAIIPVVLPAGDLLTNLLVLEVVDLNFLLLGPPGIPVPLAVILAIVKPPLPALMPPMPVAEAAIIDGILLQIQDVIMGIAPIWTTDCHLIEDLWNDNLPVPLTVVSVEGHGIEVGTPYVNLKDFISGPWLSPPYGLDFASELTNVADATMLANAVLDLADLLAPGVGLISSWPIVPTFPTGTPTAVIIGAM